MHDKIKSVLCLVLSRVASLDSFVLLPTRNVGSSGTSIGKGKASHLLSAGKTLYEKIWESHVVEETPLSALLYVDRHLVHEVTSPQAFEGLRLARRGVRRPDCTLVTVDHNVPTINGRGLSTSSAQSRALHFPDVLPSVEIPTRPLMVHSGHSPLGLERLR